MRHCGVSSATTTVRSPLRCAFRHLSRRWTTPIRIQPPHTNADNKANELTQGALVWKWSDDNPNAFAFIPIIPVVSSENGILEAAPLQASTTFHKITARIREVASMICVLERTMESPFVLVRRNGAVRFARDEDGSVTVAGHIYPYLQGQDRADEQKHNFATVIDPVSVIALKHHLESVLRHNFNFDRYFLRERREQYRSMVEHSRYSTARPPLAARGARTATEPVDREVAAESAVSSPKGGSPQYASQREELELAARGSNAADSDGQNLSPPTIAPKPDFPATATEESASTSVEQVAENPSRRRKGTESSAVTVTRPAKGVKESKKERSRRKKKEEALETQQLFDI